MKVENSTESKLTEFDSIEIKLESNETVQTENGKEDNEEIKAEISAELNNSNQLVDKSNLAENKAEDLDEMVEVEEIYVKYKGRSYLHCEWKTSNELEEIDKRVVSKINRYKMKFGDQLIDEDEYFNNDYTIVDRVLDEVFDEKEQENYAFVKWRSLPYDECTWELSKYIPQNKIEESRQRNNVLDTCKAVNRK